MDDAVLHVVFNGKLLAADQAAVPVTSRGLMYGDGCFETLRSYRGQFLRLDEHLARLKKGVEYLSIGYPPGLTKEKFARQVKMLLSKNDLLTEDAVVRVQVWRKGKRGYRTTESSETAYSITATGLTPRNSACDLATVAVKRIPAEALPSRYKLSNGINYILAADRAVQQGADDALLETIGHNVSETTIANIFWFKNETVYTPSTDCDILPGITRRIVLHLLKEELKVEVKEGAFSMNEVKDAEGVWICNSVKEVQPVCSIDETRFEVDLPFIQMLETAFRHYRESGLQEPG